MEVKSALSSTACPGTQEQVPITHGHTATASEDHQMGTHCAMPRKQCHFPATIIPYKIVHHRLAILLGGFFFPCLY